MIKELISQNRLFSILHEELVGEVGSGHPVLQDLMEYADIYARINRISVDEAEAAYLKFIGAYRRDVLNFAQTGQYPTRTDARELSRVEYDLVLLLSTILTRPRFRIIQLLAERAVSTESSLFVGVGSGLELYLLRNRLKTINAFDLCINPLLREGMSHVTFCEEEFRVGKGLYEQIFLIEVLEHLNDPFNLVSQCGQSLQEGGRIHLTTATNIPQFDHRVNFPEDHQDFDAWLHHNGFEILFFEDIPHLPVPKDIGSRNRFYTLAHR